MSTGANLSPAIISAAEAELGDVTDAAAPRAFVESRAYSFLILSGTLLVGAVLLAFSLTLQTPNADRRQLIAIFLNTLATTIIVSGGVGVAYEWMMRARFMREGRQLTRRAVSEAISAFAKNELADSIDSSIARNMPARYKNLVKVGIEDAFPSMHMGRWKDKLSRISKTRIRILKIYIAEITELETVLLSALDSHECTAQILLLHPDCQETLEKRASCLPDMDADAIKYKIIQNLDRLRSIHKRLGTRGHALDVRLHRSFVAVSLQGQGTDFTMGLYLNGRTATQNVQIRVRGPDKELYQQLDRHFDLEWEKAEVYPLGNALPPPAFT